MPHAGPFREAVPSVPPYFAPAGRKERARSAGTKFNP